MTLFQGQRRARKENFKLCFLKIVVQCSFQNCMMATHWKDYAQYSVRDWFVFNGG